MNDMEILCVQKATLYDLTQIIDADPSKTFSNEELKQVFNQYIQSME